MSNNIHSTSAYKQYLILLGALCFSTSGILQAYAPIGATPFVIGSIRMIVAGIALFLWCLYTKKLKSTGIWKIYHLVPAVVALTGYQLFFFTGILQTGIAVGSVIAIGSTPIFVAVLSFLFFREPPQKIWYPATAISIIGLILINIHSAQTTHFASLLLPLGAGFSFALYFIASKPLVQTHPPELVMMVLFLLSGVCLFPVFFYYPVQWIFTPVGISFSVAIGTVTTALAYTFLLEGLKYTNSPKAATLSLAEPIGATCFGVLLLGEHVTFVGLMGLLCVLGSVLILTCLEKKN